MSHSHMIPEETKKKISMGLTDIVNEFNEKFQAWAEATGCRANFGWNYGATKEIKSMVIVDIDARIYQKPVPGGLQEALAKLQPKTGESTPT